MKQFETILSSQEILTKQGQYMIFTTVEKRDARFNLSNQENRNNMMKRTFLPFITLSVLITASGITLAADFNDISDDDFFKMRDQMQTMDDGARDAYRTERQSRMMNMDQSQRDSRFSDMGASGKRNMDQQGQRNAYRKRDGSGGGQQRGKGQGGKGQGSRSGEGSGNQYRYGQSNSSDGGSQYRYGQGNSTGSGSQNRYGQGSSTGGGRRYGGGR